MLLDESGTSLAELAADDVSARTMGDASRSACGPAGICTEEYDVRQRQLRGSLPQASVHAGLLETVVRLSPPRSRIWR